MKILIGAIVIVCLMSFDGKAQLSGSTKIHFLNTMFSGTAELKTTIDPKNPIRIKPRVWIVIQPVGDSLSFIINQRSYPIHFEPNRQYYFFIQTSHFSNTIITEKSEREFILTATTESAKGPEEYVLSKSTN